MEPCHFNKCLWGPNALVSKNDAYCGISDILAKLHRAILGVLRTIGTGLSHCLLIVLIILHSHGSPLPDFSRLDSVRCQPWAFGIAECIQDMDLSKEQIRSSPVHVFILIQICIFHH